MNRVLLLLATLLCCLGCDFVYGKKNMDIENVDWKALEFTCKREQGLWPRVDEEADGWFKQARKLEKENKEGAEKYIIALYEKAAERNHFKAINNLALMYRNGYGVPVNENKAVELVERLMAMNIGAGYYQMGNFLEQGVGVKQDRVAALAYYRKSADLGDPQGQFLVGKKLVDKFLQTPMRVQAIALGTKMLECSLSQGHAPAGYELGMTYAIVEENIPKSLAYFQQSAALGHRESVYALEGIFEDGEYNLGKDPQRAACYRKLYEELRADPSKKFPNIDRICPLPPKPMPEA